MFEAVVLSVVAITSVTLGLIAWDLPKPVSTRRAQLGRTAAEWSLVASFLWVGGLASVAAVIFGAFAIATRGIGRQHYWFAAFGVAIGIAGSVTTYFMIQSGERGTSDLDALAAVLLGT